MEIHVLQIIVICVLACLAWFANERLNTVPYLKNVVQVVIIVAAVLILLQSLNLLGDSHTSIQVN